MKNCDKPFIVKGFGPKRSGRVNIRARGSLKAIEIRANKKVEDRKSKESLEQRLDKIEELIKIILEKLNPKP